MFLEYYIQMEFVLTVCHRYYLYKNPTGQLKVHMLGYMDKISINSNSLDVSVIFLQ